MFLVFNFFLHGLRRCDSLFRSCWRERRLRRMCVYMYVYVYTYCFGYVYFTCPCILRVRRRTYKHLMVQYKLPTLPSLAAWLPLVLTSVTPSLCRNKGSLCPRHEVRMVPLFRAMRACLWKFQRLGVTRRIRLLCTALCAAYTRVWRCVVRAPV